MKRGRTSIISVEVSGTQRVQANMNRFAKNVQEAMFVRAVRPALELVQADAKANLAGIPSKSGGSTRTRDAIASKMNIKLKRASGSRYYSKGTLAVFYGRPRASEPQKKPGKLAPLWARASLAHLIEYGFYLTHFMGQRIRPIAIAGREFMSQAFESKRVAAERKFVQVLKSEIGSVKP